VAVFFAANRRRQYETGALAVIDTPSGSPGLFLRCKSSILLRYRADQGSNENNRTEHVLSAGIACQTIIYRFFGTFPILAT